MDEQHDVADVAADERTALEQLVLEYTKLAETKEHVEERQAQIRAVLASKLDVDTHELAGRKVIVSAPERLDSKKLERAFPAAAYPQLYKTAIDTRAVRDNIAGVVLATEYTMTGSKTVQVR